jgi:hypothetical protein
VAAGAVYVGATAVRLDSDPSAGAVQVTPELVLSFATVAVSVDVSVPSIVVDDAVTETAIGFEPPPPELPLPPHPERVRKTRMTTEMLKAERTLRPEGSSDNPDMELPLHCQRVSGSNYT